MKSTTQRFSVRPKYRLYLLNVTKPNRGHPVILPVPKRQATVRVTMPLDTILALSDRSYVMEKGRIIASIEPGQVTASDVRRLEGTVKLRWFGLRRRRGTDNRMA
jgi:hypothetical protein